MSQVLVHFACYKQKSIKLKIELRKDLMFGLSLLFRLVLISGSNFRQINLFFLLKGIQCNLHPVLIKMYRRHKIQQWTCKGINSHSCNTLYLNVVVIPWFFRAGETTTL